jgi:hypothetical protein
MSTTMYLLSIQGTPTNEQVSNNGAVLGEAVNRCLSHATFCLVVRETSIGVNNDIFRLGFHLCRRRCQVTDNPGISGEDRARSRATSTTGK